MIDLYNIPNDNHKDFRLKKFVEYQHEVPSIHYRFLGQFIKLFNLSKDDVIWLAWLLSVTYNEITCVFLYSIIKDKLSADFFLELIVHLKDYLGIDIKCPLILDWKNCANLTSGIYNIFYEDKKANDFDKYGKIEDEKFLYQGLLTIQKQIQKTYPQQNSEIPQFIGKICSFRNLFKNARYAGFHHDRQLEWILTYKKQYPQFNNLWNVCFDIRKQIFDKRFLGELNGWKGIRKERKKYWLKYGLTGAEK